MKIAIVHPSLAVRGGAEQVVLWLAEELSRRGHGVTVIASDFDEGLFGSRADKPFSILTLDLGGYAIDPVKFLRAGWSLRRMLEGFDCINPHNFPSYIWAYIAKIINPRLAPIVWFCEEPVRWFYPQVCNRHLLQLRNRSGEGTDRRPRWQRMASWVVRPIRHWRWEAARFMDRWVVARLDRVLTNSGFIASQVRSIFRIHARPCLLGIPLRRFSTLSINGGAPQGPYMLTVSRLFAEKNVDNILQAVKLLKDRGPLPFQRYVVAGDGPLREALTARSRELGIGDVVEFAGAVSDQMLADLYRRATLVVYLPLDETFGLVFLEAALYKRPVLGPDHGGPTEIIQHGVTGLQVNPLDPGEIAEAIAYCFRDPELLKHFGEEGYRRIRSEFTVAHFVDRFEEAVQGVDGAGPR